MRRLVLFTTGALVIATAVGQAAAALGGHHRQLLDGQQLPVVGNGDNHDSTDADTWSGQHLATTDDSAMIAGNPSTEWLPDTNAPASICN